MPACPINILNEHTCMCTSVLPSIIDPLSLRCWFTLMWDLVGANGFDVDTGSTQTMHSQYAFNLDWENTVCTCTYNNTYSIFIFPSNTYIYTHNRFAFSQPFIGVHTRGFSSHWGEHYTYIVHCTWISYTYMYMYDPFSFPF